jgi:hypothetical protein
LPSASDSNDTINSAISGDNVSSGNQVAAASQRLNYMDIGFAPIAIYCGNGAVKVLDIQENGDGQEAFNAPVIDALLQAEASGYNTLIVENIDDTLWALPGNVLKATGLDRFGVTYSFQFDAGMCLSD